jgi:hypothetical protein
MNILVTFRNNGRVESVYDDSIDRDPIGILDSHNGCKVVRMRLMFGYKYAFTDMLKVEEIEDFQGPIEIKRDLNLPSCAGEVIYRTNRCLDLIKVKKPEVPNSIL